jgi:hypothetical protein
MRATVPVTTTITGLLFAALLAVPAAGAATSGPRAAPADAPVGTGHAAAARSVTVSGSAANAGPSANARAAAAAAPAIPLGRDGSPAGSSLPVVASPGGTRPAPGGTGTRSSTSGPATGARAILTKPAGGTRPAAATSAGPALAPAASPVTNEFQGINQAAAGCGGCQAPDVTAAVSTTQLAETVNLVMRVFTKSGATVCTESLPSLFGAVTGLSRPRIEFDNAASRFSIVADSVPGTSGDVPIQYLATSQTSNACGAWWVYSINFGTSAFYPLGALLDYPYLGQDSTSILSSTNNFSFSHSYLGSSAYAIPKAAAYSGAGFSFNTYQVAFSTAPVTVAGIPTFSTANTYWIAAVPGTGYDLYVMPTNPAGAITLQAVVNSAFTAPTRRVNQPGTSTTLDPLDGRIESAAVQDGSFVWFAHGANDQGFPTVRYGAVNVTNNTVRASIGFHSSRSDDFNPSIGLTDVGGGNNVAWINWAYTNTPNGVPVTATVVGLGAGSTVPNLAAVDLPLATGTSTGTISAFGGYSSVAVDPAATPGCPAGLTALTAQELFTGNGPWTTWLAETSFC